MRLRRNIVWMTLSVALICCGSRYGLAQNKQMIVHGRVVVDSVFASPYLKIQLMKDSTIVRGVLYDSDSSHYSVNVFSSDGYAIGDLVEFLIVNPSRGPLRARVVPPAFFNGVSSPYPPPLVAADLVQNHAPRFLATCPDTVILENTNLRFTYIVSDPDKDAVTVTLISGPTGLVVDSAGQLSWTPTYSQSGTYQVIVSLSDGLLAVKDTALVKVTNVNRPPKPFTFTQPTIDTVRFANIKIEILFTKSFDEDNDSLWYCIRLNDTTMSTNDTVLYYPSSKLRSNTNYMISGFVTDGMDSTLALNTKQFRTAKTLTGVGELNDIPVEFSLTQNYPNPFNPSTTIRYGISSRSHVHLVIYNIVGQVVADLVNAEMEAGWNLIVWNASVSSGLYFYRFEAVPVGDPNKYFVDVKKMLLLH